MRLSRILVALLLLIPLAAASAEAVTVRDLVELSKAGLSDDVLIALIDVDRSVFSIDTATLKMLKQSGVSEAVIIAMIRSGRTQTPPLQAPEPEIEPTFQQVAPEPEPRVIVIDHHDPVVREVPVAVPVAVPVFIPTQPRFRADVHRGITGISDLSARPPIDLTARPPTDLSPVPSSHRQPCVYWGFGGKLRPGSWQPTTCQ
jgi:hypothetical protein